MIDDLIQRHLAEWQSATHHPFLDSVRDGSLPAPAFDTWLAQDALFVADLLAFQATLLARAPRPCQAVLISGLAGLEEELGWFERQAVDHGVAMAQERAPVTRDYLDHFTHLLTGPFAAALTALCACERAYLEAWSSAAPGAPQFRAFVEHWTDPLFAEYVEGLTAATDAVLAAASEQDRAAAEEALLATAALERRFWDMALG